MDEKLKDIRAKLAVLYSLQKQFCGRTLENIIQNLEADVEYLEKGCE